MSEGTNKVNRDNVFNKIKDTLDGNKILKIGRVVDINDDTGMGRIKVAIKGPINKGGDDGTDIKDLPWCFPMMTKLFSVQPKVGEAVFVFIFSPDRQQADRMYLGPILSQSQYLIEEDYFKTALNGFTFSTQAPNVNISNIPQLKGVFPNPEDVSVQGRFNTDITQKSNEIVIRAGKFMSSTPDTNNPYPFTFNSKTQGYIQIKNDVKIVSDKESNDKTLPQKGTITNIVSNKINLLTHNGSPSFNLLNQDNLISDDDMNVILSSAHQLAFGDIQLQYLILLKNAFLSHVHNGSGNIPSGQALIDFKSKAEDLEKQMLSKNIRIN